MLVIDGREISWQQFGRMMMGFEGWQFKLEIRDRSEDGRLIFASKSDGRISR
jgi:hypothetical protein